MGVAVMGEIISVRFSNGQTCQYPKGVTVLAMSQEEAGKRISPIVAAIVNNELWDLQIPVEKDSVVEFLDLHSDEGIKVYQRSLTFVLVTAAAELFPDSEITVEHSLSKGLYCELHRGQQEGSAQDIAALEQRMEQIVAEDRPIIRKVIEQMESEDGWVSLGAVGTQLQNLASDFDSRTFGFRKLSDLVRGTGAFDIDRPEGGSPRIRLKGTGAKKKQVKKPNE